MTRIIKILTQALQGSAASVRQVVRGPETHWLLASTLTASEGRPDNRVTLDSSHTCLVAWENLLSKLAGGDYFPRRSPEPMTALVTERGTAWNRDPLSYLVALP